MEESLEDLLPSSEGKKDMTHDSNNGDDEFEDDDDMDEFDDDDNSSELESLKDADGNDEYLQQNKPLLVQKKSSSGKKGGREFYNDRQSTHLNAQGDGMNG